MSRRKKVIRNFIILGVLLFITFRGIGIYLTPIAAHEYSERRAYYGPSEVVHVEDYEEGKLILSKYDRWISCSEVYRVLFFFWMAGHNALGFENDKTKAINWQLDGTNSYYTFYGIINDDKVKKVQLILNNGQTYSETEFHDNLFLFIWKAVKRIGYEKWLPSSVRGYDENNNVIFEEKY